MLPTRCFYNKACNWRIGFLQIVNISKLYHILGSNHSTFYVWSFQVSFLYKFLVLKMQTLLYTKYMWKTIIFHCLLSSRCLSNNFYCNVTNHPLYKLCRCFWKLIFFSSSTFLVLLICSDFLALSELHSYLDIEDACGWRSPTETDKV
jgi:hypothetical protein